MTEISRHIMKNIIGVSLILAGLYGGSWLMWYVFTEPFQWHTVANFIVALCGGFSMTAGGIVIIE